jgi:hypothetical protein
MSFSSTNIIAQKTNNIARQASEPSSSFGSDTNNDNDKMVNSLFDLVSSSDENKVLQDARQILTNREQRHDGQHQDERVLDESTTARVSKQSGDEDPMQMPEKTTTTRGHRSARTAAEDRTKQCRRQQQEGTHFVEQVLHIWQSIIETKNNFNLSNG